MEVKTFARLYIGMKLVCRLQIGRVQKRFKFKYKYFTM